MHKKLEFGPELKSFFFVQVIDRSKWFLESGEGVKIEYWLPV